MNALDNHFIFDIILTIIGLIGNGFVLYVLTRKQFIKITLYRYLIAITISDVINLLFLWPMNYHHLFLMDSNSINCKSIMFTSSMFNSVTPWFILLSSFDRFLSIKYPLTYQYRKNLKYQIFAIFIITVVMILLNIPEFIFFDVTKDENNVTSCGYSDENALACDIYYELFSLFVPFGLMIIITSLIGYILIKNKTSLQTNETKYKKNKHLIKVLIVLDLYFLICNLPYGIFTIYYAVLNINAYNSVGYTIVNDLTIVYNSFNFFVYMLSNKNFRKYFLERFCCKNCVVSNFT